MNRNAKMEHPDNMVLENRHLLQKRERSEIIYSIAQLMGKMPRQYTGDLVLGKSTEKL